MVVLRHAGSHHIDARLVQHELGRAGVAMYDLQPSCLAVVKPIPISKYIPANTGLGLDSRHAFRVGDARITAGTVLAETCHETTPFTKYPRRRAAYTRILNGFQGIDPSERGGLWSAAGEPGHSANGRNGNQVGNGIRPLSDTRADSSGLSNACAFLAWTYVSVALRSALRNLVGDILNCLIPTNIHSTAQGVQIGFWPTNRGGVGASESGGGVVGLGSGSGGVVPAAVSLILIVGRRRRWVSGACCVT